MTGPMRVAVLGASGRMGRQVLAQIDADPAFVLAGCWSRTHEANLAGTLERADVAVDFTVAGATASLVQGLDASPCALVTGTTGRSATERAEVAALADRMPVFVAENMSIAVHVVERLAALAANALQGFDVEISESHHAGKRDAPSGTALRIAQALTTARGLPDEAARLRAAGARADGEIGIRVQRGGGVIGDHEVALLGQNEVVEIRHRALDRSLFAAGALDAARWLFGRGEGLYTMQSMLADRLPALSLS